MVGFSEKHFLEIFEQLAYVTLEEFPRNFRGISEFNSNATRTSNLDSNDRNSPYAGLYPDICFRGGSMKLSEGTIEWPKATSRGAKRRVGVLGCYPGKILKLEG